MRDCNRCRVKLKARKATKERPYKYTLSGLPNVYLTGITVNTCPVCEAEGPIIPKIDQLHDAIAGALIRKPGKLSGEEVRFLRKLVGVSSKDFATLLGVGPAHLSKIENGKRDALGTSADRLARVMAAQKIELGETYQELARYFQAKSQPAHRAGFRFSREAWKAAA